MRAAAIVESNPGGDSGTRLAAIGIALEIDLLVFQGAPQPFDEDVVDPAAAASVPVKAAPVNWLP
jgi:hypothetical protein